MRKQVVGLVGAASVAAVGLAAGIWVTVDSPAKPVAQQTAPRTAAANDAAARQQNAAGGVAPNNGVRQAAAPFSAAIGATISRAEIVARAKYWFDNRGAISYSWTAYHRDPDSASHKYRQDGSGYVSEALHLSSSLSTVTLPSVGTKIARTSMQPGDFTGILGNGTAGSAGHARLFEAWVNKSAGTYMAYDLSSAGLKHQTYKLSTDAPLGGISWTAYRYKKLPGATPPAPPAPRPAPKSSRGGTISRAEVIARAKYWFDNRAAIPYSWTSYHRDPDSASHTYRQDCSGFVSEALHLNTSLSTVTLPGVGTMIPRTSMQPGDFTGILGANTGGAAGHVRIFEKWANKSAGTYWAYDDGETPIRHQIFSFSTDAPRNGIGWTAYRYNKIS